MGKAQAWWERPLPLPNGEANYATAVDAELARAQQVGEDVAQLMIEWWEEHQPCPACGVQVGDHSRRQLRRCDAARPALVVLDQVTGEPYQLGGHVA